jgi:sugar phosphate isomerase/epimerase
MGIRHMMCSGVADTKTVTGYRTSCALFNSVGARLRDAGIAFNYHNHAWEFDDLGGGAYGMEIIASETDPALVKFNIDVFWVTIGGRDPSAFIREHASRAGYFHFKDGRRKPDGSLEFLEFGRGVVDLKGSMATAREVGAEWIVAEQDRTELPHLEAITITRDYMRRELGV